MIFPVLVILITINSSANGELVTRNVIATFVYGTDEGESVKCKAIDVYNTEIEKGVLSIDSVDQEGNLTLGAVQIIKTFLRNDYIARTYYLHETNRLAIFIAKADSGNPNQITNPDDSVELQILPNVKGDLSISKPQEWNVSIPYRRHDVPVQLTTNTTELTILEGHNRVFDCSVTSIEQGLKWMALKIKKGYAPVDFMKLKYSTTGIFLTDGVVPEEEAVENETPQKSVFQATFGFMKELDDEYYAEIKIHPGNTVVVITTADPVNPVRLVYGFTNEETKEIMCLRGSPVMVASPDDPTKFVNDTRDFLWAFTGAESLQAATPSTEGTLENFTNIAFAEKRMLTYDKGDRSVMVFVRNAAPETPITQN